MEKVRVGILGTGGIAKIHAWALSSVSNVNLVAVASRDVDRAKAFASGDWGESPYTSKKIRLLYKIEKYTSYEELLKDEEIDAVYVCLPNALHYEYCLKALENGKHCFVEKPMTVSYEEAAELVEKAKEVGKILQVGHMWRFHGAVAFAKKVVEKGLIGEVVKVRAFSNHRFFFPKGWFLDPELSGGGSLIDMGVHALDTVRFILDSDYESVYAHISTSYISAQVDDTDILFLKASSGIPVIVESGWAQVHSSGVESSIEVYGKKGFVSVFPTTLELNIEVWGSFHPMEIEPHDSLEMFKRQAENFANAVLGLEKPGCSGEEGAHIVRVVEAAYESSKTGKVVKIKPDRA